MQVARQIEQENQVEGLKAFVTKEPQWEGKDVYSLMYEFDTGSVQYFIVENGKPRNMSEDEVIGMIRVGWHPSEE